MKKWIVLLMCGIGLAYFNSPAPASDSKTVESIVRSLTRAPGGVVSESSKPSVTFQLHFEKNSARLRPEDVPPLQDLGQALSGPELSGYVFKIEGHTCDLGAADFNLKLSRRRAAEVADFLMTNYGIPQNRLEIMGYGENRPETPNVNESARQRNRRVVIINTLKPSGVSATPGQRPRMAVQIKQLQNGREVTLAEGATLTQNDRYAIEIRPESRGYVYVYQIDAKGNIARLFPKPSISDGRNPLAAGSYHRVPGFNKWFYLDDTKGKEAIMVIARARPIRQPDRLFMELLNPESPKNVLLASRGGDDLRGVEGIRDDLPVSGNQLKDQMAANEASQDQGPGGLETGSSETQSSKPSKTKPESEPKPETKPKVEQASANPQVQPVAMNELFLWSRQFMHR